MKKRQRQKMTSTMGTTFTPTGLSEASPGLLDPAIKPPNQESGTRNQEPHGVIRSIRWNPLTLRFSISRITSAHGMQGGASMATGGFESPMSSRIAATISLTDL